MEIEIVEFYLAKLTGDRFAGTLHIYLPEMQLDIRGVIASGKIGEKLFFGLPVKKAYDIDEKKEVMYPIINFTDQTIKDEIIAYLHVNAGAYIAEKIRGTPKHVLNVFKSRKGPSKIKRPFKLKNGERKVKKPSPWTFKRPKSYT